MKRSAETITRLRASHIGKRLTVEQRQKISKALMGHKHSAETRAKISASNMGRVISEETREKIRQANIGKSPSAETRGKIRSATIGRRRTDETRAKMRAAQLGKKHSEERRARASAAKMGHETTPEHREKIRAGMMGKKNALGYRHTKEARAKMSGENSPRWRGGISKEAYSWDFTPELKEEVRRRDEHKCQLCGAPQEENIAALAVHHIDYDKTNSDPVNLVSLCWSCHARTGRNRKHWTAWFQEQAILQRRH